MSIDTQKDKYTILRLGNTTKMSKYISIDLLLDI